MARNSVDSDEFVPFLADLYRQEQQIKAWDKFEDPPIKYESGSMVESKWIDLGTKFFKIVAYIVTFVAVLVGAVFSKGTLLFMTSQIAKDHTRPYCNKYLGIEQQFVVTLPQLERVVWIWMIIFTFFVPQILTFLRSVRICCFKTWTFPKGSDWVCVTFTESVSTVGSALFVFCVLPELDVVRGAMLANAVCFIPAVLGLLGRKPSNCRSSQIKQEPDVNMNGFKMVLDVLSIVAQFSSLVVWPLLENKPILWLIPISAICISFGWWENYVSEDSPLRYIKWIGKNKKVFENSRYFIYIFLAWFKCAVFFFTVVVIFWLKEGSAKFLFNDFERSFQVHSINVTEIEPVIADFSGSKTEGVIPTNQGTTISSANLVPTWVFLINIISGFTCYAFGKFACKIGIHGFSYAFPVNLVVPTTISGLIIFSGLYNKDECYFSDFIPSYLFFNIPSVYFLRDFITNQHAWVWLLWLLSQTWISVHIWSPGCERLARTEKLFVRPMYEPYLVDQSLALNRRRDDKEEILEDLDEEDEDEYEEPTPKQSIKTTGEETIRIFACGTMWHETKEEMMEFLKSIIRLDEDHFAKRLVRTHLRDNTRDYFELETHIFFDDAFVREDENDNDPEVNQYVNMLVGAVDDAASEVHETRLRLRPPKKYITPYGGRLEWTLPGKTKMFAHLKDAKKIRKKKRWSQVMYMYYLLGHRLMERDDISPLRKDLIAENTFILALDGDIDFQPQAVHLLVDCMKKNRALGAACGRIHPMGSGPMVWYQMFEYAVGHWLQKATEHMIGCVLCSPGCFSLFRAKALMDKNVMKKYTTRSEEARHFVQYDQGEDRWLCTLLLQRGYRVEYSAASDAYTHCPEGFNEFYNQRRRWMPSTTANILDLLVDYKRTVKINDNISRFYILYQVVLMGGTILGPGTIFLMLVGAFVAAFQMDQWSSFLWNAIPILIFMFVCYMFKSEVQLFFAGLFSAIYGLVMMAVLVGVMLQISNDGILAPSSLFFFCIAGEMVITGLLHPKELGCLPYGIVYYVTVPSMYMLLVIYSIFNLNNVSWGTREVTVVKKAAPVEVAQETEGEKETGTKKERKKTVLDLFGGGQENSGTFDISIAGLFRCMLCTHNEDEEETIQLINIKESLVRLEEKLDVIEKLALLEPEEGEAEISIGSRRRTTIIEGVRGQRLLKEGLQIPNTISPRKSISDVSDVIEKNSWLYEEELGKGECDCISSKEKRFWEGLLDKYLHPIDDKKESGNIEKDLKDLRDKCVIAFFMLNSLFVLVVFLLTLNKDLIHVNWPLDIKVNFTYLDDKHEILIHKQYLQLEPIGFVFLLFFATLLGTQFIAMLFHRFGTFSQILSTTTINLYQRKKVNEADLTPDEILNRDPVKEIKKWIKIRGAANEDEEKEEQQAGRRKTVCKLAKTDLASKQPVNDLMEAFQRRLTRAKLQHGSPTPGARRSQGMALALDRRITIAKSSTHVRFDISSTDSSNEASFYDNPAFLGDNSIV